MNRPSPRVDDGDQFRFRYDDRHRRYRDEMGPISHTSTRTVGLSQEVKSELNAKRFNCIKLKSGKVFSTPVTISLSRGLQPGGTDVFPPPLKRYNKDEKCNNYRDGDQQRRYRDDKQRLRYYRRDDDEENCKRLGHKFSDSQSEYKEDFRPSSCNACNAAWKVGKRMGEKNQQSCMTGDMNVNMMCDPINRGIKINPWKKGLSKEVETDERKLRTRQRQIDIGKGTEGYQKYIKEVKREDRTIHHPQTPEKSTKCSTRSWQGIVRIWRRKLHYWDPPSVAKDHQLKFANILASPFMFDEDESEEEEKTILQEDPKVNDNDWYSVKEEQIVDENDWYSGECKDSLSCDGSGDENITEPMLFWSGI